MVERLPMQTTISALSLPAIMAIGNPLLDILVILEDEYLLRKYDLKLDDEREICEKTIETLIADLPSERSISAGGSAQNTLRIMQWLCGNACESQLSVYVGAIGNDLNGATLEKLVREAGIDVRYAVHPTLPTGICVSLIKESARSLVANIGAAAVYTLDDLRKILLPLDTVKIIYIEGYFIVHSLDVAREIIKQAQSKNVIVAFNLNGLYIFKDHHAAICEMVGLAKIVFGNVREMIALARALNVDYEDVTDIPFLLNSLKRISTDVSSAISGNWLSGDGIFVMTQGGSAPAMIVWGNGESAQVDPIVPEVPIVDTTGAGDSLVAGVLVGILATWDPKTCLQYGCKVASFFITKLGITMPESVPPNLIA